MKMKSEITSSSANSSKYIGIGHRQTTKGQCGWYTQHNGRYIGGLVRNLAATYPLKFPLGCFFFVLKAQCVSFESVSKSPGEEVEARRKLARHLGVGLADLKIKPRFHQPLIKPMGGAQKIKSFKGVSYHKGLNKYISHSQEPNCFVFSVTHWPLHICFNHLSML
jgi:hypothetical protein